MPWRPSSAVIWLAAVLLPPVGLILLWLRPGRIFPKVVGSLGIGVAMVVHLVLLFGLRVEMDGSGVRPILTFRDREKYFAEIERSREAHPPVPEPEPAVVTAAAPEPAAPEPAVAPAAPYWTVYRGPAGDGSYAQTPILTVWPAGGLARLWKIPVGLGYSSMVVADGRLFTIDQRRDKEVIAAYDVKSGRQVWAHSYPALFQEGMGGDGPRATPTWHEGLLYSLGATGVLKVLDAASGAVKWEKDILKDNGAQNLTWGMAASPLIADDKVIVQPGGADGRSVVAYHRLTGGRIWQSLNDAQAYTSPVLVTIAGRKQVVTATGLRFVGLSPEDGKLLWEFPWVTEYGVNASQPLVIGENRLFISAGYDHGAALLEIERRGEQFAARQVWFNKKMKNKFSSPVLHEGHIYGLDEAIMACVRASDGEQMWKGGRYGYGQLLLAAGHLVVLSERGEIALVKATPERHVEVARFPAIEGKTWNVPAMADGVLYVRNLAEMAAFRISP